MGEIRSTLDIIMERTKNLSLSEEEKQKIKQQEWLGKARGWVQKYLDGLVDPEELQAAMATLGEAKEAGSLLRRELIEAVDLEGDNARRWEVLETLWGLSPAPFLRIIEGFRTGLTEAGVRRAGVLRTRLAEKGISGTAVVPNLNRDPEWLTYYGQAVRDCREALVKNL
ncbi:MAG: hypothetical protein MUF69_02110 [Desulfobacterota bacterium]|jgi:hypothetical protein|nr:hypothetical protein [Thermodesulfobacteriota bacterium]